MTIIRVSTGNFSLNENLKKVIHCSKQNKIFQREPYDNQLLFKDKSKICTRIVGSANHTTGTLNFWEKEGTESDIFST